MTFMPLKHLVDDVLFCTQSKPGQYRTEAPYKIEVAMHTELYYTENVSTRGNINMNVYQEHGYDNRKEYLESLAEEYGVDIDNVRAIADLYGDAEDFDGLVTALEDHTW